MVSTLVAVAPGTRHPGGARTVEALVARVRHRLPDVPVFVSCGLAITVPHASAAVRARAHYVTRAEGGFGAVREVCEMILAARGAWAPQLAAYGA